MQTLSKGETKKGMKYFLRESASTSVKDSVLSSYLIPFALVLGATNVQIGMLSSIPRLFGTIFQPIAGKYIETLGGKKSTTLITYALIPITLLLIAFLPFSLVSDKVLYLIIFTIFYQIVYTIDGTSWHSWFGDIVPEKIRGEFFGKRNMVAGFTSLIVSFCAGWFLNVVDGGMGFSIVFSFAAFAGFVSYMLLREVPKSPLGPHGHFSFGIKEFFRDFQGHKNFSNYAYYTFFLNFGVYIASPFFIVFMLRDLNIGYFEYAIAIAIEAIAALCSQKYWGKLSDKFGDRAILGICAVLISFVPLAYVFVGGFTSLLLAQIFSGFAWAGFDLANFNFLLDATPPQKRPSFIANYKFFTGFTLFAGGILSGFLLTLLNNIQFLFLSGIKLLFLISFFLRIIPAAIFIPRLREQRVLASKAIPIKNIFWRVVAIYPAQGIMHEIGTVNHCISCWEQDALRKIKSRKLFSYFRPV